MHEGHHDHCCSGENTGGCGCGHKHDHDHAHGHCHNHEHTHEHAAVENTGANETVALLDYMLKHNEHHTIELETVKQQLETMGLGDAAGQMDGVIEDYQKGNIRLAAILSSIKDALK